MTSNSDRPGISKPAIAPGAPVLVVGGRGFVGSAIVRQLIDAGFATHVLGPMMATDLLSELQGQFGSVPCGIEDEAGVSDALARIAPAAIVVCSAWGAGDHGLMHAGESDPERAFAINVDAMRRLFDLAHRYHVGQVAWTSSTTVFGDAATYGRQRVDETAPKRPTTVYGLTKHLAEEIAAFVSNRHGLPIIGLRLPLVLGPGLWYRGAASAYAELFAAAKQGLRFEMVSHDEPVDLMHVEDAARAMLTLLRREGAMAPIYHVNGFTACASEVVDALRRRILDQGRAMDEAGADADANADAKADSDAPSRVPGALLTLRRVAPPRLFPLVDDTRFRADTGFAPRIDLERMIEMAMGSSARAG